MSEVYGTQPLKVHIAVENFGPIEKTEIDLRPLTVFVGESNTGKTYLAALIYALFNTFEGFGRVPWVPFTPVPLHSIYDPQDLSPSTQSTLEEIQEAIKKLNTDGRPFTFSDLPQKIQELLLDHGNSKELTRELKRCFDIEGISQLIRFTDNSKDSMNIILKIMEEDQYLWSIDFCSSESGIAACKSINEEMVFILGDEVESQKTLDLEDLMIQLGISMWEIPGQSYYLPAARSGIMETRGVIASSLVDLATSGGSEHFTKDSTFSGMIGDFLKQIINYQEHNISADEMITIAKTLEKKVLRGEIVIKQPAGAVPPQFLYHPQGTEQGLRMSRSSSMVSELAPLVLFLRGIVKPGDTLIIEEPEAHLHPRAQTKIAITFARLVRAGVRVIITTHSDWLLEQIGNVVREGEVMKLGKNQTEPTTWLTEEEVGAWWFHADKPVEEIKFDRIEGYNPPDYYDVASGLYNNAVEFQQQLQEEEN